MVQLARPLEGEFQGTRQGLAEIISKLSSTSSVWQRRESTCSRGQASLTVLIFIRYSINDVQVLISFKSRLQELDLSVTFYSLCLGVRLGFLIAVGLIQLGHFINSLLVLHLDLQLEFQLMQHTRDLRRSNGSISLNQVEIRKLN